MLKKNEKSRLRRLIEFIVAAVLIYAVVKAPVMWICTDVLGLHYLVGGFIAGSIVTLANFLPSEFWIWKKKETTPK